MVMILLVILATQRSSSVGHQTYCPKVTGWKKSVILNFSFFYCNFCLRTSFIFKNLFLLLIINRNDMLKSQN